MKNILPIVALAFAACSAFHAIADVRDTPTERSFALPSGAPVLVVKRQDWTIAREQRNPGNSAVYYMLTSDDSKMVLSVYIDKTTVCQSAETCLVEALKNPAYKDAREQKPLDAAPFKGTQFFLDQPKGTPVKQAHVLAAAYLDGHWFDVHISKTGPERPDLGPLLELLKSLSIR